MCFSENESGNVQVVETSGLEKSQGSFMPKLLVYHVDLDICPGSFQNLWQITLQLTCT